MKEKLRKPLTALMMAWGTYLAIPCPYKVWDDALRPWQIVCRRPWGWWSAGSGRGVRGSLQSSALPAFSRLRSSRRSPSS